MGEIRPRRLQGASALLKRPVDFRKRFPLRLGRPAVDDEVDSELEFHLDMRRREMLARGMTEAEARRAALDRFGDVSRARHACLAIGHQRERQMRLLQWISELRQDTVFAVRQLFAAPAFSLVAIATLALGLGATTAIFSVVHAVVLRPLPIPEADRVVVVNSGWRDGFMSMSPLHYLQFADDQQTMESVAALEPANFTLAKTEGAERVVGGRVTGDFFALWKIPPAHGRVFGRDEDTPGREQVVVLSHKLWKRQFAEDPAIVGREISLNQRPYVVIGVMPPVFDWTEGREELWVPTAFSAERRANRTNHTLSVYGRLREGVSLQQAVAELPMILQKRIARWPDEPTERTLHVRPMMEPLVGSYRERLYVLLAAVVLVLLIACGNVSNLLLARGTSRARELALRSALGAGQARLLRQLFTESVILGAVSAAAGLALASWFVRLLISFTPPGVPRIEQAALHAPVVAFAVLIAFASSLLFGLMPAWRASRTDVQLTLKDGNRSAGSRGSSDVVRSILIAAEVALAVVLLVSAALLIRTGIEMQRVRIGFDTQRLFTGRMLLSPAKYRDAGSMLRVTSELETTVSRIPGVRMTALSNVVPGVRGFSNGLLPQGKALDLKNITQSDGVMVTPSYFATLQLPIVRGRGFTDADRQGAPLVVILNRTAAEQMWPGENPIGKKLTSANPLGPTEVIGIAEDVLVGGPSEPAPPTFYVPFAQLNDEAWGWSRSVFVVARTEGDPAAIGNSVRRAVSAVDPNIPLFGILTIEERMASTIATARFNTVLLGMLGAAGLLLAAVGIYGVIGYFATQRTSEIGIRMALGASRGDVVRLIVRQAAVPALAGIVLGALGAGVAANAIASQLVNVTPTDPLTFIAVAAGLLVVALLAALIPARRAAGLDPTRALHAP